LSYDNFECLHSSIDATVFHTHSAKWPTMSQYESPSFRIGTCEVHDVTRSYNFRISIYLKKRDHPNEECQNWEVAFRIRKTNLFL